MRGKIVPGRKKWARARCQMKIRSTQSEHRVTESAVMTFEIEALPDRAGYLKLPSKPHMVVPVSTTCCRICEDVPYQGTFGANQTSNWCGLTSLEVS